MNHNVAAFVVQSGMFCFQYKRVLFLDCDDSLHFTPTEVDNANELVTLMVHWWTQTVGNNDLTFNYTDYLHICILTCVCCRYLFWGHFWSSHMITYQSVNDSSRISNDFSIERKFKESNSISYFLTSGNLILLFKHFPFHM